MTPTDTHDQTPQDPQDAQDAPESDDQTTPEPEGGTGPEQPQEDDQDADDQDSGKNREAQKLRKRLRDAEAERDAAREAVTNLQGALVTQEMKESRVTPDALWATGHTAEQFITADGTVDQDALKSAITATAQRFGIPTHNTPIPDPSQGSRGESPRGNQWINAFGHDN